MRILALDFDGVISDSAPEAFVIALRTYIDLLGPGETPLAGDLATLEEGGLDREIVVRSALYADFVEAMPLGNGAIDFAVELTALERGDPLRDQQDYDAYKEALLASRPEFARGFRERFYQLRREFASRDEDGWLAMMAPYPDFVSILRRRASARDLAIATAKDFTSVRQLLGHYALADLFSEERVLDKETGVSKRAHLAELSRRLDVPLEQIVFVDDKVNHLEDVQSLGVRAVLAAWGYNGPREQSRARACGFEVCDLADVEHVLFDAMELPSTELGGL
jgi:phosphoglycolate phosphatase-like HAD superfamily hydrolase